eukprot:CAMPEP_0174842960 /NCGR_PEP_ID=MMETSP1114-20130205/10223_1 /TAXON_ID=312471 /ORGANISM="Neobodo designis, Strain CCAP 1951/1" /LENGTH=476 /DNA_ID=CAMNT_0016077173 /DNA_START=69 /DNA_END=1499 /DNA_ORIENTATION=+
MAASTSTPSDPPLYMSGRNFVDVAGHSTNSRSSRSTLENPGVLAAVASDHHGDDHTHSDEQTFKTFHALGGSGEPTPADGASASAASPVSAGGGSGAPPTRTDRHPSLGADIAIVPSGVSEALDRIAGDSITDSEAAGYTFRAEEDEQLEAAVAMLNEHRKLQRREQDELRLMQLTAQQLQEMTGNEQDMCTVEYFDAKYFSDEAKKVWSERAAEDASPVSKRTVRLFAGESAILAQARAAREAKQAAATAQSQGQSMALSHPLLHRRAMRNEERRAAFRAAALERQAANEAPSLRNASAEHALDHKSIYSPQRDLFGRQRALVKFEGRAPGPAALAADAVAVQRDDTATVASSASFTKDPSAGSPLNASTTTAAPFQSKSSPSNPTETSSSAAGSADASAATEAAPRTLAQLLAEQKTLLADMKTNDDEVYRPVLDAFYRYDAAVHEKLGRILDSVADSNAAAAAGSEVAPADAA